MTNWLIPCNPLKYDVEGVFQEISEIDWKQSNPIKYAEIGDKVYIYISKPVQAVKYYCEVISVNKKESTIDDSSFVMEGSTYKNYGRYMTLRLIKKMNEPVRIDELSEIGIRPPQGPHRLKPEITSLFEEYINIDEVIESVGKDFQSIVYKEGKRIGLYTYCYERNQKLRKKAIEIHGTRCLGCRFSFLEMYGEYGEDYIEIHHTKPLSSIKEEVIVNPDTDLVPLCSNCHRIVHRRKEILTINELKMLIKQATERF
ncbi:HNH endonuclease [Carnobacterium sp. FSL E2-0243]|uniref:HNH endonuclease n=1 Tax=Carnobacterium sp. FSL E2-0243 TaxID=2921365 RepID=UPI0030F7DAD9